MYKFVFLITFTNDIGNREITDTYLYQCHKAQITLELAQTKSLLEFHLHGCRSCIRVARVTETSQADRLTVKFYLK